VSESWIKHAVVISDHLDCMLLGPVSLSSGGELLGSRQERGRGSCFSVNKR
jgi:hypothetical protein